MAGRKSKQKECILRVVKGTKCHPTAEWIYDQVRKEMPSISLGTIYRNLKLMKQEGEIIEIGSAGSMSRFDCNTQNHYHFRCERCNCLVDLDETVDIRLNERLAQKTGFKVNNHRLEFFGLCQECSAFLAKNK